MENKKLIQLYKIYNDEGDRRAELLISNLMIAESFIDRACGLLGQKDLKLDEALWIKPCNNIHTFFMRFSIDCIFLNKSLKVEKVFSDIVPFRIKGPVWKSTSVVEFKSGFILKNNIKIGDQFHVVY